MRAAGSGGGAPTLGARALAHDFRVEHALRVRAPDFERMSSLEIVDAVSAKPMHVKFAMRHLEARPPDPVASARLIEHYRAGRAPAWLTAFYLGLLRDPQSYDVLREILVASLDLGSESYAGVAMAKLRRAEARDDLVALLTSAPTRKAREGAMYGLRQLRDASVAPAIVAAMAAELLHPRHAGSVIGELRPPRHLVVAWLSDDARRVRECAVAAVQWQVRSGGVDPDVAAAALATIRTDRVRVWGRARAELEAKLSGG